MESNIIILEGIDIYGLFNKDGDIIYISTWINLIILAREKLGGEIFKIDIKKVGKECKIKYSKERGLYSEE